MSEGLATHAGYPFGPYVEPPAEFHPDQWAEANATPGRFQLINSPALPGKCAVCGYAGGMDDLSTTYKRQFIDFNFSVDGYGAIVFCTACINSVAEVLGYIEPERARSIELAVAAVTAENQELRLANDGLRSALHTITGHDRIDGGVIVTPESIPLKGNGVPTVGNTTITGPEHESNKPASKQGRDSVSSNSGSKPDDSLDI